jgi:hypothetical protein
LLSKPNLDPGIGETSIDLHVEFIDNLARGCF